ncbi:DUF485 domain-containing protein [Bradyrhizobium sp. F1.13.3]|uniref:DUF485 domain-containing protein n=1 Tax=Bradyrhizobium sp. F1.13.3 TaxID=3156351 RepID=UPI003392F42B
MDLQTIQNHPSFKQLASERARLGLGMSIVMAATYFAYILTVAFWPRLLGLPLWSGTVISWGVVIGVALIALGFLLTAIYVLRANSRFDLLSQHLLEDLR